MRAYQSDHGLSGDGVIDPPTWTALSARIERGDRNDAVRAAQILLNGKGQSLKVDGVFGRSTQQAVRAFQEAHGLEAHGVVGAGTGRN